MIDRTARVVKVALPAYSFPIQGQLQEYTIYSFRNIQSVFLHYKANNWGGGGKQHGHGPNLPVPPRGVFAAGRIRKGRFWSEVGKGLSLGTVLLFYCIQVEMNKIRKSNNCQNKDVSFSNLY